MENFQHGERVGLAWAGPVIIFGIQLTQSTVSALRGWTNHSLKNVASLAESRPGLNEMLDGLTNH